MCPTVFLLCIWVFQLVAPRTAMGTQLFVSNSTWDITCVSQNMEQVSDFFMRSLFVKKSLF